MTTPNHALSTSAIMAYLAGWLWLSGSAVSVALLQPFLPVATEVGGAILFSLSLLPLLGLTLMLVRSPERQAERQLAYPLVLTALYAGTAVWVQTIAGPPNLYGVNDRTSLFGLLLLPGLTLLGLFWVQEQLTSATPSLKIGFSPPGSSGLGLSVGLVALLTLGWPMSGALGDSLLLWSILLAVCVFTLSEELMFRGLIWGILVHDQTPSRYGRIILATLPYIALWFSYALPHGAWARCWARCLACPYC